MTYINMNKHHPETSECRVQTHFIIIAFRGLKGRNILTLNKMAVKGPFQGNFHGKSVRLSVALRVWAVGGTRECPPDRQRCGVPHL